MVNNKSNNFTFPISLLYFILMALLPSHLSLKLKSSLRHLLITLNDPGHVPSLPPSDYFMSLVKNFRSDIFHALICLNSRNGYGADRVPPIVLKTCASVLAHWLPKLF